MYICNECKHITEELRTHIETYPYGDTTAQETITDYECNCCNGEYEEAKYCKECEQWFLEEDFDFEEGYCIECAEIKTLPCF